MAILCQMAQKTSFTIKMAGDSLIVSMPEALTVDGFATIEYRVERDGIFAVTASSGDATTSATLILTTQGGLAEIIMPTATPLPEASPTPLPSPTPPTNSHPILILMANPQATMTEAILHSATGC